MNSFERVAALAVIALGCACGTARAQGLYGSGGLFLNPTADFMERGRLVPSLMVIPQQGPAGGIGKRTLTSYALNYGVTDRLEVGALYLKVNPGNPPFEEGSPGGSIKYKLWEKPRGLHPVVAVGASFASGGSNPVGGDADERTAFVALRLNAQKRETAHPAHIHLGLFYADKYYGYKRSDVAPYAGVDIKLARKLTGFAEIRGKLGTKAQQSPPLMGADGADIKMPVAVGAVWHINKSWKIALAYANNGWSSQPKLGFGIGYAFGGRNSK